MKGKRQRSGPVSIKSPRPRGSVREHILSASLRLLAAHGFDGTTLQAVADEVGVTKPSVLHYFPSKEALREAVLTQIFHHWSQVVPAAMCRAGTGPARFDVLSRELVNFYTDVPDRARLILREMLDRPAEYRRLYLEHVRPWMAMIADGIVDGQRRGFYRSDVDAEMYLVHVVQLVVVTVATAGVLAPPMTGGARAVLLRELRDVGQLARTCLFVPGAR